MSAATQSGLEIVGNFRFLHEAHAARGALESAGIRSWVLDENMASLRWDLTGACGGVRLAVAPDDAVQARTELADGSSAALADLPEMSLPAAERELCPRCGEGATFETQTLQPPRLREWLALIVKGLLLHAYPRRRFRIDRRCGACDHAWSVEEQR